ncbi:MAG TPA: glutaredoxin family protein [Mycobacteriales bacterium]|nr:glutaredoxin family protein [Mycobacteriales bacterium]
MRLGRHARVGTLTFVTRAGCSLCAEAQPLVERLATRAGVTLEIVDVDTAPGLGQWSDHVPVVLLDGAEHSRWWVEERALAKALGVRV